MTDDFFDLGSEDRTAAEQGDEPIPEGFYRATVAEVDEDINSGSVIFQFKIAAGPHKGRLVRDTLFHPNSAKDPEGIQRSKNRRLKFATRFGLITEADWAAKKKVSVKWTQTLHKEVFIKVIQKKSVKKDKAGKEIPGEFAVFANLSWDGIYPVNHEKVPVERRGAGPTTGDVGGNGAAGAGNGGAPTPAAPAPKDYAKSLGL